MGAERSQSVNFDSRSVMAKSVSDEELQLKKRARRRLVGAIVVVTAVVVVLPMVLDTDPKPVNQDISIRIPSTDSEAFTSKVVPVAPPPEAKPVAKAAEPAKAPQPAKAKVADSKPAPAPTPAAKVPAEPVNPAAAPAKPAAPAAGQYVLQVIALADAAKASQIQQKIAVSGVKAYTEVVKTEKGDVTRVRAGPFDTAAAAEKARSRLQAIEFDGRKLDGKVIAVK